MKPSIFMIVLLLALTSITYLKSSPKSLSVFSCKDCDYIIDGYLTQGEKLQVKPGQVICFSARMNYQTVRIEKVRGTAAEPVIIRNCGGVAYIREGLRIADCQNFKLLGDGAEGQEYGIKVSTHKSFYITFETFTSDFEVARVEVAGYMKNGLGDDAGFAGLGIKTSPYQACDVFRDATRKAWVMRNVSVHNNYIHDVGGEGMYIGHGFYSGRIEKGCQEKTYSHSIQGLRVHHNLVENTGFDGIQVKNADADCEIYNNVIRNYGTLDNGAQNEGLMLADGVTGKAYNNLIDTGTGNGIMFQGMGNNDIFNNIVLNAGEDGFNGSGSTMGLYLDNGYFRIFNNTIYNSGEDGFVFFLAKGGEKRVMNNLVVKARWKLNPKGAKLEMENNIFSQDSALLQPDRSKLSGRILKEIPSCIDHGTDVRKYNPSLTFDFYNHKRPLGKGFDIGAIEFQ